MAVAAGSMPAVARAAGSYIAVVVAEVVVVAFAVHPSQIAYRSYHNKVHRR